MLFQAKNSQEGLLLEDIHAYMKKRAAIEKTYSEALLKLTTQFQSHKIIPIPDLGQKPIQSVQESAGQPIEQPPENVRTIYSRWNFKIKFCTSHSPAHFSVVCVPIWMPFGVRSGFGPTLPHTKEH